MAAASSAFGQAYTVTDVLLDNAYGINNLGQVCGSTNNRHPGIWTNGQLLDLGTFGGAEGYADKINDSGHVCGAADIPNGERRAFYYDGVMHNLGSLGGPDSDGRALNNSNVVVGGSRTNGGNQEFRPFRYQNGQMLNLGSFGGTYAAAEGINDSGVIVGWSDYNTPSSRRAFRYQNGQMVDLGTLGGATVANDINNNGRIIGYSENAQGRNRAFVHVNNQMYNLGTLPGYESYAQAINNKNQIVGTLDFSVAAKFEPTGPKNLNDFIDPNSGWDLQRAQDINDSGQIVGLGWRNNAYHAFLLTPIQLQLANPVPGLPGRNNTFTITRCTPGKRVYLTYSLQAGSTNIEAYCYGVTLDLRNVTVAGSAVADSNGVATFIGFTPNGAAGRTVRYQALELDSCRKTNRVDWTY